MQIYILVKNLKFVLQILEW